MNEKNTTQFQELNDEALCGVAGGQAAPDKIRNSMSMGTSADMRPTTTVACPKCGGTLYAPVYGKGMGFTTTCPHCKEAVAITL